ncbi:hypothetical protein D3C77_720410 [compost metagenome]
MFDVDEMARSGHAAKFAVACMQGEQACILDSGVFVPLAIDEQQGNLDGIGMTDTGAAFVVQHGVDMELHLGVFVDFQRADVAMVVALVQ